MIFSIGQLAKQTDCKVPTIRYYEQIGLLSPAFRSEGNQRRYNQNHLAQLRFIRHARELGFSQQAIRDLIRLQGKKAEDCAHADKIAGLQLAEVRRRITQLEALAAELESMLNSCSGDSSEPCQVLEVLSDHSLCHGEHELPEENTEAVDS